MKMGQDGVKQHPPVKVAEKNLRCYSCGGLIRKGSAYLRKDFVKTHYKRCPVGEMFFDIDHLLMMPGATFLPMCLDKVLDRFRERSDDGHSA